MNALPWHTVLAVGFVLTTVAASLPAQQAPAQPPLAHTRSEFRFTANASFEQTAPLFGAHEERKWSAGWNPQFVYPNPARDELGMVFRAANDQFSSVWVNTAFDLTAGHIQYAYVVTDVMTTLLDIHLTPEGGRKTGVTVVYQRTALLPEANQQVQQLAKGDAKAGPEWAEEINRYLAKESGMPSR